jgi:DNA-binding MarR family transcriptional regulator
MNKQDLHILRLMGEIERDGSSSQRELSRRLNLSLGLVNTFLKRLVNKGYFKAQTMPRNRVKYFLTPKGLARKSRLTVEYLHYSVSFYKEIRSLILEKFKEMEENQFGSVLFLGAGEVAELAYLYLQRTGIKLAGIIDDREHGSDFFGLKVEDFDRLKKEDWDAVLLTRLEETEQDMRYLIENGVHPKRIAAL